MRVTFRGSRNIWCAVHQLSTGFSLLSSSFLLSPVQFGKNLGKQRTLVLFSVQIPRHAFEC